MSTRKDRLALMSLGVIFIVGAIFLIGRTGQEERSVPYSSLSAQPDGLKGLYLWLDAIGLDARNSLLSSYDFPSESRIYILVEPKIWISGLNQDRILDWVRNGGRLILAGTDLPTDDMMQEIGCQLQPFGSSHVQIDIERPIMLMPELPPIVPVTTQYYIDIDASEYLVLGSVQGKPVLVLVFLGDGFVLASSNPALFTNQNLQLDGPPRLILNIISDIGNEEIVWFDEWHQGLRAEMTNTFETGGPSSWLWGSTFGQSLLLTGIIAIVALALSGRSMGRTTGLTSQSGGPKQVEHINATANLHRVANHRQAITRHYIARFKRGLALRYGLDSSEPTDTFFAHLNHAAPGLIPPDVNAMLQRADRDVAAESDFVAVAAAISKLTQKLHLR